jgi:cell wall assembly regulator SMI1
MFLEYFLRAGEHLRKQGLNAALMMGTQVSEQELKLLDANTDFPMPSELRLFYLELGDGFQFVPDENNTTDLVGWEPMYLADYKMCNRGFGGEIKREAGREIRNSTPGADPSLLRQEVERRKLWIPFYGFVGGGDYLCLDLSSTPPPVRFYQALTWTALPHTWDFVLASSFSEFIERWSYYHFLTPVGEWTSFCRGRSGRFDWAPPHFPHIRR